MFNGEICKILELSKNIFLLSRYFISNKHAFLMRNTKCFNCCTQYGQNFGVLAVLSAVGLIEKYSKYQNYQRVFSPYHDIYVKTSIQMPSFMDCFVIP